MPAYAVIGAQWGDEGKGKIVDLFAERMDFVVRYAGGNNAGHTVKNSTGDFQLHLVPSGICSPGVVSIIGNGVVIDPDALFKELDSLSDIGLINDNFFLSDRAHVIMPYHIQIDMLEEEARGNASIGTTGRGVGPAYMDKIGRSGIQIGDLTRLADVTDHDLMERLSGIFDAKNQVITKIYNKQSFDKENLFNRCIEWGKKLAPYVKHTEQMIYEALRDEKRILLEGAQGTLLDVDHGSYPYVTSSSPSIGGTCTGLGINTNEIKEVIGIYKAYCTRVGSGPMPTEMDAETANMLREIAGEYGVTTGRARRIGWFDGVAGKYSQAINGFTSMVVTRLDILDKFQKIKYCVGYEIDGERLDYFIPNVSFLNRIKPVYKEIDGWNQSTYGETKLENLPKQARRYLDELEELVNCKIGAVSTGPRREETIILDQIN
jgi:adenylosuccinate synthase|tara:strand:- start:716 stop:2014 length:1299 start_codon:yes stop_codon:yes gene_type:complete